MTTAGALNLRKLLFFSLFLTPFFWSLPGFSATTELEQLPDSPWIGLSNEEISGLVLSRDGNHLLTVGDNDTNRALYLVEKKQNQRFNLQTYLDFENLEGYKTYRASLNKVDKLVEKDRRHDFEGIARCDDHFFLIDERVRKIIKFSKTSFNELNLDLTIIGELWLGSANAGFEGIAVDCASQHLFIAKERDPRLLIKVDLVTGKIIKQSSVLPRSSRDGQKVINFRSGEGLLQISPDISDLYFYDGFLYILERYTREIVKIDPSTFSELQRVSYFKSEFGLYQSPYPFGLAEGLAVSKDKVFVGLDHNGEFLSEMALAKFGVKGAYPTIFVFKRPKGF